MKINPCLAWSLALAAIVIGTPAASAATLSTGFSYQGRLFDGGVAANGQYEMEFVLRDRATGGNQVGTTVSIAPVTVTNGLFQVTVDFGTNSWDGNARWLDVSVRTNGSTSPHTLLTPSQLIQPVPYAIHAIKAGELVGTLPSTQLAGSYPNAVTMNNAANAFGGNGSGLTSLNASQLATGTVPDARLAAAVTRDVELLTVSNVLSGQINGNNSSAFSAINLTSNDLSDRLLATNAVLVGLVNNGDSNALFFVNLNSNTLTSDLGALASALSAFTNQVQTGDNNFSGTNQFLGHTVLTNSVNQVGGDGSLLTGLNGSQITSGTVADARIAASLARDSEMLSVSNALNSQLSANSSSLSSSILTTSNGLDARLVATNAALASALDATNSALMTKINTTSNALQTAIDAEASARGALATMLQTGDNSFAGSNHFSGIVTLTNANNVVAGNGAALTALNADAIASGTISTARLPGNVVLDDAEGGVSLQGGVTAPFFSGIGSSLTSLNASQLTSGTVADARVDSSIARDTELNSVSNSLAGSLDATNTALMSKLTTSSNALQTAIDNEAAARASLTTMLQTGDNSFAGSNHFSGIVTLTNANNVLAGNGAALTALDADAIASGTISAARLPGNVVLDDGEVGVSLQGSLTAPSFSGNGGNLTSLNASQLSAGTVPDARLDAAITRDTELNSVSNSLAASLDATNSALMTKINTTSNALDTAIAAETSARTALATQLQTGNNSFAGSNHFSGIVTLTNANNVLAGNGAALTALDADAIASGTISTARLPGNVVLDDGEGGVDLQGGVTAPFFSGAGSSLTSLNASQLSSGTVPDGRLAGNIPRLDAQSTTFTGPVTASGFTGDGSALTSLNANNLSSGTIPLARMPAEVLIDNDGSVTTEAVISASGFNGLGSGLTSLNASQLSSGTVSDDRLSANVTRLDGTNVFTGTNRFSGEVLLTNAANVVAGNGSALTALNADALSSGTISSSRLPGNVVLDDEEVGVTLQGGLTAPSFSGSGGNLTGLNASQLSTGTVPDGRLAGNIPRLDAQSTTFTGPVTASGFTGSGADLTGLNASSINSGTLSAARLPSGVVIDDIQTGVTLQGPLSAPSISGSGSGLTGLNASQLSSGTVSDDRLSANVARLDGTNVFTGTNRFAGEVLLTNAANTIVGTFTGNGSGLTGIPLTVLTGTVQDSQLNGTYSQNLTLSGGNTHSGNNVFSSSNHFSGIFVATNTANVINGNGAGLSGLWRLGGNSGTTPGTDFIGTSDNQALEFKVNGERALRIAPDGQGFGSPNFLGGSPANILGSGVEGAVIAGGGASNLPEIGAKPNSILADYGVIGGGYDNTIQASAGSSVIGGGENNEVERNTPWSVIAGGGNNVIGSNKFAATISGGSGNSVTNRYATVPGGRDNRAGGDYSFAAGRRAKADNDGAFVWADSQNSDFTSSANNSFNVRASGGANFTVGSFQINGNDVQTTATAPSLSGNNTLSGNNVFSSSNHFSGIFVATNTANVLNGDGAGLSGLWRLGGNSGTTPGTDFIGSTDNQALVFKANNLQIMRLTPAPDEGAPNVVLGAEINTVGSGILGATISGGGASSFMNEGTSSNIVNADYSTIGGGVGHVIHINGYAGTIAGGIDNLINTNGDRSTIGGGTGNSVGIGVYAGTIAGGGNNSVNDGADYGTIGGGRNNQAGGGDATVAGGQSNQAGGSGDFVGGGALNISSGSAYGVIAGGFQNTNTAQETFIGSGRHNLVSGAYGVVPGGISNAVTGFYGFAAGRQARSLHEGAFVWADAQGGEFASGANNTFNVRAGGGANFTVGSFQINGNDVQTTATAPSLSGNNALSGDNTLSGNNVFSGSNHVSGRFTLTNVNNTFAGDGASLSGLWKTGGNTGTTAADFFGTTDGQPLEFKVASERVLRLEGGTNTEPNLIGGISANSIASGVKGAAIVSGGTFEDEQREQPEEPNAISAGANFSVIVGGFGNEILSNSENSFIGGGESLTIKDDNSNAVIAGGRSHEISTNSDYSVISGGDFNRIFENARNAVISGGSSHEISTNADHSVISGGNNHLVGTNAQYAMIPGGRANVADGSYSFAGGRQARALHDGAFVWADSTAANFDSTAANEFRVRANGGMVFNAGTADIEFTTTGSVTHNGFPLGGGQASDRNLKKNFEKVDKVAVLEKLAAMEITRWNYKTDQDGATKHIGPMLQDFKPAFYPGREQDKIITWQEMHGVELAAIQGLNQKLESKLREKDEQLSEMRKELDALKELVQAMQKSAANQ